MFFTLAFYSSNLYFHILNSFCTLKLFGTLSYSFNSSLLAVAAIVTYAFAFTGKIIYSVYLWL